MNENNLEELNELDDNSLNLDELESSLSKDLENELAGLNFLEEDREKIGSPEGLGDTIEKAVWEQFMLQIGVNSGKEFIDSNNGKTLDLRDSAHIQTTKNFEKGQIATHNTEIDFQQRYDNWQSNFVKNEDGSIKMHTTRSGRMEETIVKGARRAYDEKRATGSVELGTDMDHTISAGELIRDPATNAHLTQEERVAFANSSENLNEIKSSWNRSKGDTSMKEWLDNPNKKGQKPSERFGITEKEEKALRKKDKEARAEEEKLIKEGEKRSIEAGRKSQIKEAVRIGKKALKAVALSLLADFLKTIIRKLINWLISGEKSFKVFLEQFKSAWEDFWSDLESKFINAGKTIASTIATAIFEPFAKFFTKAWTLLKEGGKILKKAIDYIKDPANKGKPFSALMPEVGKIVVAGLSGMGAILLGGVIEKTLLSAGLGIQIFPFGSLAGIIGMFLGAVASGLIGALVIRQIDEKISNKLKLENITQQIEQGNKIRAIQAELTNVTGQKVEQIKQYVAKSIIERHKMADEMIQSSMERIQDNNAITIIEETKNDSAIDQMFKDLNNL